MAAHVFAYGSLADDLAAGAPPAVLLGHRRVWGVAMDNTRTIPGYKLYRRPDGRRPEVCVAFLDLEPDAEGPDDGGLLEPGDAVLAALDLRERQYHRVEVTEHGEDPP